MTVGSAYWIAAVRARETERPDRLFADPYAGLLAGDAGRRTMALSEQASGGENAFIPVRVRWFDDQILASIADGVGQVVLLGAGFDTRPYRLALPKLLDWYEVDRREVFQAKEAVLGAIPARCRRHLVQADLADDDWPDQLSSRGFDSTMRTLWLAEGLLFYLTRELVVEVLRQATLHSGPCSALLADVSGTAGLDSDMMRPYRQWCERNGVPPPFGSDDPAGLLVDGGWRLDSATAPGAHDANYGRLPLQPPGVVPGRTHLVAARLLAETRRGGHHVEA